ncbi:MAG TPA: hypothetical protein VG294_06220 [Solirubrobacteraceae bacterium]|nr:hypothetical protein [Solirubrobacteraceae bacterium]
MMRRDAGSCSPASHGFLAGFHTAALIAAALFAAAAVATVTLVRR